MSAAEEKEGTRGFAHVLGHIGEGELSIEIAKQQQRLVNALTDHAYTYQAKAKGSLTLALSYVAEPDGTVRILGEVKIKEPKPKARGALFWATKQGNLLAENPRQTKLPLREVAGQGPAREVEAKPVAVKEAGQ